MTPPIPEPTEGLNAAVAAELRAAQGRSRLTAKALARTAEIPYGSLRRYLDCERHINVGLLEVLATALGTTSTEIVQAATDQIARQVREAREQASGQGDLLKLVPSDDSPPDQGMSAEAPSLPAAADEGELEGPGEDSI